MLQNKIPYTINRLMENFSNTNFQAFSLKDWHEFFENPNNDLFVYESILKLRENVEKIEQWVNIKNLALKEIKEIDHEILSLLFNRFADFIKETPPGHGMGHISRDVVHICEMLNDPLFRTDDTVEIFVGIIGGIFHDIGNSVTERYLEPERFSGHAEVGAFLFGNLTRDIIPVNLNMLIQFVIAAHTNYLHDITITRNNISKIKKPYNWAPVIYNNKIQKISAWITQATDRLDALGVPMVARHILTKANPTKDYSQGSFHVVHNTPEEDFKHQFSTVVRSKEYKANLIKAQDRTTTVLEHFYNFYESSIEKTVYSQYDSTYFASKIVNTLALDHARFVNAVSIVPPAYSTEEKNRYVKNFMQVCMIIDPSKNIKETVDILENKFYSLPDREQDHWAYGFNLLENSLYPRWYKEMEDFVSEKIEGSSNIFMQKFILGLQKKSIDLVKAFDPKFLKHIEKPDLLKILISS